MSEGTIPAPSVPRGPSRPARPNCFIAGGIRCGTTWLHAALASHPDVCASPVEKELRFFDRFYDRGVEWYHGHYPARTTSRWVLDSSPSYLDGESVVDRLHAYEPDARLIFLLRDPVRRAYSDYCRHLNARHATFDIPTELAPHSPVVQHGLYYRHLQAYLQRFRPEQMLIALYDDLEQDPKAFLDRVLRFLEISIDHTPPNLRLRTNETKPLKRWPLLHEVLRRGYHSLLHVPVVGTYVFRLRSENAFEFYHRLNCSPNRDYPPFTADLQSRLADFYRPDVEALAEWLQVDLSHWLQIKESPQLAGT